MWLFKSLSGQKDAKDDVDNFKKEIKEEKENTPQKEVKPLEIKKEEKIKEEIPEIKPSIEKISKEEEEKFVVEMTPTGGKISKKSKLDSLFKRYLGRRKFL